MLTRARTIAPLAGIAVVLGSFAARPSSAQEFSADVIRTPAEGATTAKVYVGKTKVRLQSLENGRSTGSAIYDFGTHAMTIVSDANRTYFGGGDSPLMNAVMSSNKIPPVWRVFKPTSSSDPCVDWNAITQQVAKLDTTHAPPHFTCTSLGTESVNGRAAHKYGFTSTENGRTETGNVWIDTRLHVVSRSQDSTGKMELKNVQEGPQPDAAFEIPAGYKKLDLTAALARLNSNLTGTAAGALGDAAKDVGKSAANETADEAKQKAKDDMKKKLKHIIHMP